MGQRCGEFARLAPPAHKGRNKRVIDGVNALEGLSLKKGVRFPDYRAYNHALV